MKCKKTPAPLVAHTAPASLDEVKVEPVLEPDQQRHLQKLLKKHHYLGRLKPVGERMFYAAMDGEGRWLAVLVFSAAAKHLKHRDQWIGWTRAQCDRRLSLVVNNSRFLILPKVPTYYDTSSFLACQSNSDCCFSAGGTEEPAWTFATTA